jgi:exodeoxyribonuclease V gamma subunit
LLQARLKINLWDPEQEILDQEPLGSEPRARRALSRRLLGVALKGADPTTLQWLAQAGVELPVGPIGRVVRAEALQSVDRFVVPLLTTSTAPRVTAVHSVQIALAGEQWTIQASLAMPLGLERLGWRYDQIRSRDYLQAWITHLFLGALAPARQPSPAAEPTDEITRWYGQNDHFQLRALAQPRQQVAIGHLQELLQWYRIGMVQPLPFFPDSAWELMRPGGSPQKARQRWTGSAPIKSGERDNPYYQLAFRGHPDPLDSAFEKCAKQIFAPLLDHLLVTENQWPVAGQALPQGSNP